MNKQQTIHIPSFAAREKLKALKKEEDNEHLLGQILPNHR
jgi:hypothetical protein